MRKSAVFMLGLGAFLLVLAPMLKWYMYPRLAVAPVNQDSVTTLVGPDATVFDIKTLKEIQADLTTKVRTIGDAKAAEKQGDNTVVWVSSTQTTSSDGVVRSADVERVAFDAHTAEAVNCCGEYVEESEGVRTPIKHAGLLVKFPFNTEKKTYDFWDGSLGEAVPIKFVKATKVEGLDVYEFAQTIEPTKTSDMEVPGSLVDAPGNGNVTADRMYSNVRTLWVEPNTGVIIKRSEQQDNTLNYNGEPKITITKVTTGYDDKTVKENVDKYGSQGNMLHLLQSTLPLVSLVLGLVLVVAGLLGARRGASPGVRRAEA